MRREPRRRGRVIALFVAQLALNLAWSPLFFAWHKVAAALTLLAAMVVMTAVLIPFVWRIRPLAALLLVPYLGWLLFAAALNFEILRLNPDAATLAPPAASTDIPL
jgi:translocator protein